MGVSAVALGGVGEACIACHRQQVIGYRQTGMGRSMRLGVEESPPWSGRVGATRFTARNGVQTIERSGFTASYNAAVTIGSGNHGLGFLVRLGDYVFQSPLAWYRRRQVWDAAPGYEGATHPDFNRPVAGECLFCHANRAAPQPDSLNRYALPDAALAESISCERCHGDAAAHLAAPDAASIVNPAKLAPPRRDAICEQCHLGGEARVLYPGKTWHDFRPGEALEDTFSVYTAAPLERFKVVGHAEQLALSRCAIASGGRMWCGTCHDPHAKPADPVAHYRARCLGCHEQPRHPSQSAVAKSGNCVDCHMARRKAHDSGHAAFTDHRILRRVSDARSEAPPEQPRRLAAWREPSATLAQRNLGLAYASAGEKEQSVDLLGEAGRLLTPLAGPDSADGEVLAALGLVRLLQDQPKAAALLLERAVAARPNWAPYYQKLAVAWNATGNRERALAVARRGIEVDPSIEGLYHTLAQLESTPAARRAALDRYLQREPRSIVTREAAARALR